MFGKVKDVNLNVLNGVLDKAISIANSKRSNNTTELLKANTQAIRRHKQAINRLLDLMLGGGAEEVVKGKIELINKSIELLNRENNILMEGDNYINNFIARCEELRDKIAKYILNLPNDIDRDTYIKDYLAVITVDGKILRSSDLRFSYIKEVGELYEEIK